MKNMAVILAGGKGTRMKSEKPKALLEVLNKPMLGWVIDACVEADIRCEWISVVKGYGHKELQKYTDSYVNFKVDTVLQKEQFGTGHAVMCAARLIKKAQPDNVLILCADAPLIDAKTLADSLDLHIDEGNAVTVITAELDEPRGYGRIIRGENGIDGIVEQKDATEKQRAIKEVNSGAYWFKTDELLKALKKIQPNNAQGEYYLTDTVGALVKMGKRAGAYMTQNRNVVLGANDRIGLLRLAEVARMSIIEKHAEAGVEFVSAEGVIIEPGVKIFPGAKILPNTIIRNGAWIRTNAVIGPNTVINGGAVGNESVVECSVIEDGVVIGDHCTIGPFAHLRPDAILRDHIHIGNFVEVKNSFLGYGTAVSHLTYVGDSFVGNNVNFGCGVAVANYDGNEKNKCIIKDNAFIGCNTNLVAPVTIGEAAYTAAGSTITKDVPAGALAVERAKTVILEGKGKEKLGRHLAKGKKLMVKVRKEQKEIEERVHASLANTDFDDDIDHEPWD